VKIHITLIKRGNLIKVNLAAVPDSAIWQDNTVRAGNHSEGTAGSAFPSRAKCTIFETERE
jgi:hypothetical protein